MEQFFELLVNFIMAIWGLFDTVMFTIDGMQVSFSALVFALLIVGIVINVFWKGART